MNNDVVADIFNADKAERRRILYEEMYRIKWENLREQERDDKRESATCIGQQGLSQQRISRGAAQGNVNYQRIDEKTAPKEY